MEKKKVKKRQVRLGSHEDSYVTQSGFASDDEERRMEYAARARWACFFSCS